jgi:6-phosphogluconate dehydrogenase
MMRAYGDCPDLPNLMLHEAFSERLVHGRDAFGAHTYQRNDEPDPPFVHTEWLDKA